MKNKKKYIYTYVYVYYILYIYIYTVIHRQIIFVLSDLFSVARKARFPKLELKSCCLKPQYIYIYIYISVCVCVLVYIYLYIYIRVVRNLSNLIEGDRKAPFLIATTSSYRGQCNCFSLIAPLTLDPNHILLRVNQGYIRNHLSELWESNWIIDPIRGSLNKFADFFVRAPLLMVHTRKSCPLRSNLLRLQCTCTVPTTSARPHRSPLAWAS